MGTKKRRNRKRLRDVNKKKVEFGNNLIEKGVKSRTKIKDNKLR